MFSAFEKALSNQTGALNNWVLAVSGGGDSVALAYALKLWANAKGVQVPPALIIDHGLQENSARVAAECATNLATWGYQAKIITLNWPEGRPKTGIQEKARFARYHALSKGAAEMGRSNIILAHTQDDLVETILMRAVRHGPWRTLTAMGAAAPNPIWPEHQIISLHRPFLDISRSQLRTFLKARSTRYFDDPANENEDFERIRWRNFIAAQPPSFGENILGLGADCLRLARLEDRLLAQIFVARVAIAPQSATLKCAGLPQDLICLLIAILAPLIGGATKRASFRDGQKLWGQLNQGLKSARTFNGAKIFWAKKLDQTLTFTPAKPRSDLAENRPAQMLSTQERLAHIFPHTIE